MSIELTAGDIDRIAEAVVAKLSESTKLEYHFHATPAPVPPYYQFPLRLA